MTRSPLIGRARAPELHVMSFNIRRAMDGPLHRRRDRWSVRAPAVRELLRSEMPTLLGLQEVLPQTMSVVKEALGPNHRVLGHGRGRDSGGEASPIVFDAERLELHDWGQRALSDRPHEPGSRTWGNLIPRMLTWAELSERATKSRFLVVNTHLDHLSARSRRRSAEAVLALVRTRALPAVVMGDLNASARSDAVRTLIGGDHLDDAWGLAQRRLTPQWGTFAGYRPARLDAPRIDWLLVTPDVRVEAAGVNARAFDGIRPSDHLAVQCLLRIGERTS